MAGEAGVLPAAEGLGMVQLEVQGGILRTVPMGSTAVVERPLVAVMPATVAPTFMEMLHSESPATTV